MFDYIMTEGMLPNTICPTCKATITFHGGWFPQVVVCANCGQKIDMQPALDKYKFPAEVKEQ